MSSAPAPATSAVERHPHLPVVVVGAGPAGLAAAAQASARGLAVVVIEAGPRAGSAVLEWGHVKLFSPWSELVDPVAEKLLTESGWTSPAPRSYPTGLQWVELYLAPLAERLASSPDVEILYDHRVVGVARSGRDRLVAIGRDQVPFTLHVSGPEGRSVITAAAVIDASGTWGNPNPLGGDGYPAIGEPEHAGQIFYGIPDLRLPEVEARYAGKHVAVAGRGASAQNTLVALTQLAQRHPGTRVSWLVRRHDTDEAFGGGDNDQLEARGALGNSARKAVADGPVTTVTGFRTARVDGAPGLPMTLVSIDGKTVDDVDEVVVVTGFRPDHTWLSEVHLDLDGELSAPVGLAPEIHPAYHSCGSVSPHGADLLRQPEGDLYLVGMKSYGRAPSFLTLTGYEQTRSVVAEIAGDFESAARVELVLPDSGVCGGAGLFDESAEAGCCGTAAPSESELLTIGAAAER
ncbi:FAD-dependent oxidoreductase [Nocardioides bigeumensis]|uniref:NAD(P)-binding domain-containing protein n=1 Tax=Nocardioides bigeumensis TaxID=433657 RepID=A0ABP5JDS9_9ACTN